MKGQVWLANVICIALSTPLFLPFRLSDRGFSCLPTRAAVKTSDPCWTVKSQKLLFVNLLMSSSFARRLQNLLLLVFLSGKHVHFSMRPGHLCPSGMTHSHLQGHYEIHQIKPDKQPGNSGLERPASTALNLYWMTESSLLVVMRRYELEGKWHLKWRREVCGGDKSLQWYHI